MALHVYVLRIECVVFHDGYKTRSEIWRKELILLCFVLLCPTLWRKSHFGPLKMTSSAAPGPPHVFPHLLSCLQTWRPTFWYVMFFITREQFAITFALLRFNFSFSSSLHQLCGCRVFWTPEIQMVLPSITFSQGNVTSGLSPTAECCTVATRKLLSAAPYQKELPQLVALRMLSLTPPQ